MTSKSVHNDRYRGCFPEVKRLELVADDSEETVASVFSGVVKHEDRDTATFVKAVNYLQAEKASATSRLGPSSKILVMLISMFRNTT